MSKENPEEAALIRKFLRRQLSVEEQKLLDQKMEEEAFAEKLAKATVRSYGKSQLKAHLDKSHEEMMQKATRRKKITAVVLLFLLTLFAVWLVLKNRQAPVSDPPAAIFAAYFKPYPNVYDLKGAGEAENEQIKQAINAYAQSDFKVAKVHFATLIDGTQPSNSLFRFYYAICLLADGEAEQAVKLFDTLRGRNIPVSEEWIEWYLALAYVSIEKPGEAQKILKKIQAQNSNFQQEQIRLILQKLSPGIN